MNTKLYNIICILIILISSFVSVYLLITEYTETKQNTEVTTELSKVCSMSITECD